MLADVWFERRLVEGSAGVIGREARGLKSGARTVMDALPEFFGGGATGFDSMEEFNAALKTHGLTPDRLMGVISNLLAEGTDFMKTSAMKTLHNYLTLMKGQKVVVEGLDSETKEQLEARKAELMQTLRKELESNQ